MQDISVKETTDDVTEDNELTEVDETPTVPIPTETKQKPDKSNVLGQKVLVFFNALFFPNPVNG